MAITRRQFLKWSGAAIAAAAVPAITRTVAGAQSASGASGSEMGMLIDISECIGCGLCQAACLEANELAGSDDLENLSGDVWTVVKEVEVTKRADGSDLPEPETRFVRHQCFHCLEPSCVSVCPVAAFIKTEEGAVVYRAGRCMGCRYCMVACPFNIPKYQWDKVLPLVGKCKLCYERLKEGQSTACAEACPTGATMFGRRDELLAEAHRRIAEAPDKYVPHVYGETEVGGTSVLLISDVPFSELSLRTDMPTAPLPDLTWKVVSKVPVIAGGVAAFLTAAYFATHMKDTGKGDDRK